MRPLVMLLFSLLPAPLKACGLALLLAVDVSGSVDRREYAIQMVGLADALRDGIIADALIAQQAQVSLLQWSGSSRQRVTLPWTAMTSYDQVVEFATQVENNPRVWRNYSTAIGEAMLTGANYFSEVPQCMRRVIDVSGDGVSNEGVPPETLRAMMSGLTVNALAIETDDTDLTAYLYEHVITGPGAFVFTADGFEDYPAQIKRKLQREVTDRFSRASGADP